MGTGYWIPNRPVTSEVGTEDLPWRTEVRGDKGARQWAIEMRNQAEAETAGNIRVATKGNLVGAVEQGRAVVPAGPVVVSRLQHEILIAVTRGPSQLRSACVAEVGQAVSDLEIHGFHAAERFVDVFRQLHLQSVVDRAPDRFQEECLVLKGVHSSERTGRSETAV